MTLCGGRPFRVAARWGEYLAGLDDWELLGMVRSLAGGSLSRAAACGLLVVPHGKLVCSCVRRYGGGTEPAEDLMQGGYNGLMNAISRFDPAVGTNLAAYAQACISGEIKRHFREQALAVYVNRSVQDLVLKARKATSQLTQDLGRAPTQSEMARHLGVSGDDLRNAQRTAIASRPSSLGRATCWPARWRGHPRGRPRRGGPRRGAHARHAGRRRALGRAAPAGPEDPAESRSPLRT